MKEICEMEHSKKKQRCSNEIGVIWRSPLESLPSDVFAIICGLVASKSSADLIFLSLGSRTIKGKIDYRSFREANLQSFLTLEEWTVDVRRFLELCKDCGHQEAGYWLGLQLFLETGDWLSAKPLLQHSFDSGFAQAGFAWGLFSMVFETDSDNVIHMLEGFIPADDADAESIRAACSPLCKLLDDVSDTPILCRSRSRNPDSIVLGIGGLTFLSARRLHAVGVGGHYGVPSNCSRCFWNIYATRLWWLMWITTKVEP